MYSCVYPCMIKVSVCVQYACVIWVNEICWVENFACAWVSCMWNRSTSSVISSANHTCVHETLRAVRSSKHTRKNRELYYGHSWYFSDRALLIYIIYPAWYNIICFVISVRINYFYSEIFVHCGTHTRIYSLCQTGWDYTCLFVNKITQKVYAWIFMS